MQTRQFVQLLLLKVHMNLRSEVSRHQLNYVWWVLEPALFVAVFYVVFGVLLDRGGNDFVVFLVCGQIPFLWFSRSITNSSNSIMAGKNLIGQVDVPKAFFPLVDILQDSIKQFFVFSLLVLFLLVYGIAPTSSWLFLPVVALTQGAFILATGLSVACIVPILPDFRFIVSTGLMMMLFASGVFYSYTDFVSPRYQELFLLNPLASLIKNYRQVLLDNQPPDFGQLLMILAASLVVAYCAARVLRRYHGHYSRLVMQ